MTEIRPISGLIELFSSSKSHTATPTDYYHYNCCGGEDYGWGCAYRCGQMIVDNLIKRSAIPGNTRIPTLLDIQLVLAKLGIFKESDVGSTKWIEPPEVKAFIQEQFGLDGLTYKFSPKDNSRISEVLQEILVHFQTIKTPIMIDDTLKAYILVGIREVQETTCELSKYELLLFDPHIADEDFKPELPNGNRGVRWRIASTIFNTNTDKWLILFPKLEMIKKQ